MSTTTTTEAAAIHATLTDVHAAIDAPVLPYAGNVTFITALREARCYDGPFVLQRREAGPTVSRPAAVLAVTHWDAVTREADVLLWHHNYGGDGGSWHSDVLTVNVDNMDGGSTWFAIDNGEVANRVAAAAAAAAAANDELLIPRNAADALHRARILRLHGLTDTARALTKLAAWLPGGDMMQRGHALAVNIQLCGEYEAAVCPTLGWTPRRGEDNSRMALTRVWMDAMGAIEADAGNDARAAIDAALERVERGGIVNRAICEHAENHLERHKRPAVNELLAELGMDAIGGGVREYEVEVRVERSRTVTEYAIVTVTVEASDDDEARDAASDAYGDELDGAHWIVEDDHYDSDITDYYIEDVTEL